MSVNGDRGSRRALDHLRHPLPAGVHAQRRRRSTTRPTSATPASYPFTRGVYETMYRGKPWTMRQFAGFGTAEETNRRFRYLLDHGQTGLSTAFDMPTLMGYDSDHPRSLGEVGREGVAVDTLADMEDLFAGIPLDQVTTSMTVNAPAAVVLAPVHVRGRAPGRAARAAGRHDPGRHPQGVHRPEGVDLPARALDAADDRHDRVVHASTMPRWHPVSISGYHIREAGATAAQELAFTLADGFAYVERCVERGHGRRRVRAAAVVLLQRPHRLLRGDRQVPRRAPDLGARAARNGTARSRSARC